MREGEYTFHVQHGICYDDFVEARITTKILVTRHGKKIALLHNAYNPHDEWSLYVYRFSELLEYNGLYPRIDLAIWSLGRLREQRAREFGVTNWP